MNRSSRILFLIGSLQHGGAERQTVSLVNSLDSTQCFELGVACFIGEGALEVDLHQTSVKGPFDLRKKRRFDIRAIGRLIRLLDDFDPHLVVAVNAYAVAYAHICIKRSKCQGKVLGILHTTRPRSLKEDLFNRMVCRYLNASHRLIFVCETQYRFWVERYNVDRNIARVIYNGVDTERFSPSLTVGEKRDLRMKYRFGCKDRIICICAGLRPEKMHLSLLDAFEDVLRTDSRVRLLVVGDGSLRATIEKKINARSLNEYVVITGFQNDVRPYLEISDICVLNSTSETFPMSTLEAMSMGRPVVAPRLCGLVEQIDHQVNGFLFQNGSVKHLVDCLKDTVGRDDESLAATGVMARRKITERFGVQLMVERYRALFEECIGAGVDGVGK